MLDLLAPILVAASIFTIGLFILMKRALKNASHSINAAYVNVRFYGTDLMKSPQDLDVSDGLALLLKTRVFWTSIVSQSLGIRLKQVFDALEFNRNVIKDTLEDNQDRLTLNRYAQELTYAKLFFFNLTVLTSMPIKGRKLLNSFRESKDFLYDNDTGFFKEFTRLKNDL